MAAPKWDLLKVGDVLPPYVHEKVTRTDLVRYAGASGDYNPMHHDEKLAMSLGMPSVFAHGMFSMGLLSNVVGNWAGPSNVESFDVQFRAMTWPDERITCTGKVVGKRQEGGKKLVDVELACESLNAAKPDGQQTARTIVGKATVALD